jgi:hypothetical protein
LLCAIALGLALAIVRAPSALELLTVPLTFLYANWVEYVGHRGPMHRRGRSAIARDIFQRHGVDHHRFFTDEAMSMDSLRDAKIVLFPPILFGVFFGLGATPPAALLWWLVSRNVAGLFVATATLYFLCYEWLHFSYHLGEGSLVGRLPGLEALRRHHQRHHDPTLAPKANFNITFPICDWLYGTRAR